MRPHSQANTRASGLARARMLMKSKLWWLEGYPRSDGWVVVPSQGERGVEPLSIDRNHLRRATYTANKLCGEFPRAMPKLVGDVGAWHAAVGEVLGTLKPWVHHDDAPPADLWSTELFSRTAASRARSLSEDHPALGPLLRALSWVLATRATLAPKYLSWVSRHADVLTVLSEQRPEDTAVALGIRCAHLAIALRPKAVEPLMQLLAEPACYHTALRGGRAFVEKTNALLRRVGSLPKATRPRLFPQLVGWTDWLLQVDPNRAKRFLRLLGRCDLLPLVQAWAQWWPQERRIAEKAHRIQPHMTEPKPKQERLDRLRQEQHALVERMPAELHLEGMAEAFRQTCAVEYDDHHAMTYRALGRVTGPFPTALRVGMLIQLHRLRWPGMWWPVDRFPTFLRAFSGDLAKDEGDDHFLPWRKECLDAAARGHGVFGAMEDLLDEDLEARDIPRFFVAQAWVREHAPRLDRAQTTDALVSLLEAVHDGELAGRLLVALATIDRHQRWSDADALRAAWMVAEPHVDTFPGLFQFFDELEEPTDLVVEAIRPVLGHIFGEDREVLRALTLGGDIGALLACGRKVGALVSLGASLPSAITGSETASQAWITEYPAELHEELARLCRFSPRAEAIAAKVLRSVRRGKAAIEAELRAVEAMLSEAATERRVALRKRRATLKQRLSSHDEPAALSEAKRDKLITKLRRRGGLALLSAVEDAAEQVLRPALAQRYGLDPTTPWLLDERLVSVLVPLAKEAKATRRLFGLMLKRRVGDKPWDLREHPANEAFVETLRKASIDPQPWLDGIGEVVVGPEDAPLRLELEEDPLEVFHMGRHFGTCLSPGNFNFFSVFANAADINKRVLYARDARGCIQGRRLLCLTQDGAVLSFHAYAHDQSLGFAEHSEAFIRTLAEAMGTEVVGRGSVPKLVATKWYDDGPVDITGRFGELEEDSNFRKALLTTRPDRMPMLLMEAFGQSQVDEVLAPMLLALSEFSDRPELAASLLPLLRHPDRLPVSECLRACRLLLLADAVEAVRRYFVRPMAHALWQSHRQHERMNDELLAFLARCAPSEALRLLRRTRPRGVRTWKDEHEGPRLVAAAIAMEGLRRRSQASRLYGLALALGNAQPKSTREEAARRLAALEARSSPE